MKSINSVFTVILIVVLSSCVSSKQFNDIQDKLRNYAQENEELKKSNINLETRNKELLSKVELLNTQNEELKTQLENALYEANLQKQNAGSVQRERDLLQQQLDALNSGSTAEIENLLKELNAARGDLNTREDKLLAAEKELEERNARLLELQNMLAKQERAVSELKDKVMNALTGFNSDELSVYEKNGKVYVSLDEKLLFKTGKWEVDPKGQNAIRELSKVLAQNTDINIMVEGHTDNVEMRGSGDVKDNWDLSVMRSTAVTKILTQNKQIDPKRIISAGRSEFVPLSADNTPEGRQINRRTEIILTPRIDELLRLIEMN